MPTDNAVKPATPLPWIVNQRKHICAAADGFPDVATTADGRKTQVAVDDAAYIVSACNAYPRLLAERAELVEALQGMTANADMMNDDSDRGNPTAQRIKRDIIKARALLARIGSGK